MCPIPPPAHRHFVVGPHAGPIALPGFPPAWSDGPPLGPIALPGFADLSPMPPPDFGPIGWPGLLGLSPMPPPGCNVSCGTRTAGSSDALRGGFQLGGGQGPMGT
jgi:hypothetical protein